MSRFWIVGSVLLFLLGSCRTPSYIDSNSKTHAFLMADSLIVVYEDQDYTKDKVSVNYPLDNMKSQLNMWDSIYYSGKVIQSDSICSGGNYIHLYWYKDQKRRYDVFNDCDPSHISFNYFKRLKNSIFKNL